MPYFMVFNFILFPNIVITLKWLLPVELFLHVGMCVESEASCVWF